jgi:hypothetical protein
MRMGPGKHLKGLELAGGIVKPEEVRLFPLEPSRVFTFAPLSSIISMR